MHVRQPCRDLVGDAAQLGGPRRQHLRDALAFARARDREGGERLCEQVGGGRGKRRRVALRLAHDAGPAQQIDGIDSADRAETALYGRGIFDDPVEEGLVEREFAARRGSGADMKRGVDLAAPGNGADGAAELRLSSAQVLGQAQAHLEIAVIHAADFPGEKAGCRHPLGAREACHAPQHRVFVPGIRRLLVM